MGTWLNQDGLFIQFGTDKALDNAGGEYSNVGQFREIELRIEPTTAKPLPTATTILSDTVFLPKCRIHSVQVVVPTSLTGGTSLSVGLMATDRTTQIGGTNGILNAVVTADLDAGTTTEYTTAAAGGGGSLIGTLTTQPAYITTTAVGSYTAGIVFVKIRYYTT